MRTRERRWKQGRRRRGGIGGFTYVGLMTLVAIMSVMLAATGEVWMTAQRREQERELLFVGNQFRQAINRYYENGPGSYPVRLEDLLKDPRSPSTRRYLRKIYRDPITGSEKWGLIKGPNGEIFGVHSLSEEEPIKRDNFSVADLTFKGKTKYADWVFMHAPDQSSAGAVQR